MYKWFVVLLLLIHYVIFPVKIPKMWGAIIP
jgi:hypothetical protein